MSNPQADLTGLTMIKQAADFSLSASRVGPRTIEMINTPRGVLVRYEITAADPPIRTQHEVPWVVVETSKNNAIIMEIKRLAQAVGDADLEQKMASWTPAGEDEG